MTYIPNGLIIEFEEGEFYTNFEELILTHGTFTIGSVLKFVRTDIIGGNSVYVFTDVSGVFKGELRLDPRAVIRKLTKMVA